MKSKSVCEAAGKADLDLLEAQPDEEVEHAPLALRTHRLDQGLVAVPEIDAAPDRRGGDRRGKARSGRTDRRAERDGIGGSACGSWRAYS